ncbi:putative tRNA pseudouridine synthase Pus10 isoform X2 [Siniperca chuatsi]|uniref:putative tRNA pseudouridine synthase Pus10 isoform X2 n=1 Tax=Siniperca chuatsi TaxID=119488 RepID=UPI001CE1E176|nr:putative tRNA pseudouridine synthase Pus10 isoform X2 [Siniperca chuatsi]
MLPLKEKDKPIVQKLLSAGCCARCVLRFCCVSVQAAYRQPQQDTLKELQAFISSTENSKAESTEENTKSHGAAGSEPPDDPPSKRAKLAPGVADAPSEEDAAAVVKLKDGESCVCVVCLGILQELCGTTQAVKIAEAVKAEKYEFDTLVLSVSLPAQLCVREHSCWLHVKKEMREKSVALDKDDVVQVKEAFKWIMQGQVAKALGGVAVVTRSLFEVGVEFTHPETDADCHFLASSCPDCFKPTKNKQSVFTRMAVVKALEKISDGKFLKHYPCPPAQPTSSCSPRDVQCLHVSVFVAGRYNKFCRSLPQTPWVIDGERRMESSVEELIAAPVLSSFRAGGFNFSSSGREDVDVRTLGNGRPFAMELLNPHRSRLSKVEMKQLQERGHESDEGGRGGENQVVHGARLDTETHSERRHHLHRRHQGSDSGPEDSSEGLAPAGAGHSSASHPQHEHPLPGLASLLPGAEDTGRDLHQRVCPRRLRAHQTQPVSAAEDGYRHPGAGRGVCGCRLASVHTGVNSAAGLVLYLRGRGFDLGETELVLSAAGDPVREHYTKPSTRIRARLKTER